MSNLSIQDIENEIIEEFSFFDDDMQKYEYLIEIGKDLEPLDESKKLDDALVKGCQSQVWLHARKEGDKIVYEADGDAHIVRGLIALLLRVLSNQPIEEVSKAELNFISKIGLQSMLSPTRANGLASMLKQMKIYSIALQAQENKL